MTRSISGGAQRLARKSRLQHLALPASRAQVHLSARVGPQQRLEHGNLVGLAELVHLEAGLAAGAQALQVRQHRGDADPSADQHVLAGRDRDGEQVVRRRRVQNPTGTHHLVQEGRAAAGLQHAAHDHLIAAALAGR
jgi:hypothetical protein